MALHLDHVRVRKSVSRNTIMVTPVEPEGADRWAEITKPGVSAAIASATVVDDACNGSFSLDNPATATLLQTFSHVDTIRRGPMIDDGIEPKPTIPGRIKATRLIRFIDLTAYNSDDPELFWSTRPSASLQARPQGTQELTLSISFDPRHPRLRETSFSAYFIGQAQLTLIFNPFERVAGDPPTDIPERTITPPEKRPGIISSTVPPGERPMGMLNDLIYSMSECFGGTTCHFTLVGVDTIPPSALNLPENILNADWPTRREAIRALIGKQVNFTRTVSPPQPPIPPAELAQLLNAIRIVTHDEYRQLVSEKGWELVMNW